MPDSHVEVPVHERGNPGEHDPETPREDDSSGEGDESGSNPVATYPLDDPAVLKAHPRDIFVAPQPSTGSPLAAPPEVQTLKHGADFMRRSFEVRFELELQPMQKIWEQQKERASLCRACLPDYLQDIVTLMKDMVAKIEDPENRTTYQQIFEDFLSNQADLSQTLSEWDKKRRYPCDWKSLTDLQIELNTQLDNYLHELKKIEAKTNLMGGLTGAISLGRVGFSAIGAELGRQGTELADSSKIYYGSASQAAAETLVANTGQTEMVRSLGQAFTKDALGKQWLEMSELPAPKSKEIATKWTDALAPVEAALNVWTRVAGSRPVDYEELSKKTRMLLDIVQLQRNDVFRPSNTDIEEVPGFVKTNAQDALTLLTDEIGERLTTFMKDADLEQQDSLDDLLQRAKKLRGSTSAELLASAAADLNSSEFSKLWKKEKDQVLADLEKDLYNGKELKESLKPAFQDGLSEQLENWRTEMKRVPRHGAQALHDATWNIRFIIRRYKSKVDAVLPKKNVNYVPYRTRLVQRLDALQLAVSTQLRQAYQAGNHLF